MSAVVWYLDSILKSRDITLPTKVHLVKANCCFVTCMQISQEAGQVDWYSHLFQNYIQKTKIMAPGPITSREIDGETVETVSGFIFLGSKITADGDCSHEIKIIELPSTISISSVILLSIMITMINI